MRAVLLTSLLLAAVFAAPVEEAPAPSPVEGISAPAPTAFCDGDLVTSIEALDKEGASLSFFLAALRYAGLEKNASALQGVTILAPNNAAFAQLLGGYDVSGLAYLDPTLVSYILLNHVFMDQVPSTALAGLAADNETLDSLLTVAYSEDSGITCEQNGTTGIIGAVKVVSTGTPPVVSFQSQPAFVATPVEGQTDLLVCGNTIHVINTVLLPPCEADEQDVVAAPDTVAAGLRALGPIAPGMGPIPPPLAGAVNLRDAFLDNHNGTLPPGFAPAPGDLGFLKQVNKKVEARAPASSPAGTRDIGGITGGPSPGVIGQGVPAAGIGTDVATPPGGALTPADVSALASQEGWDETPDGKPCFDREDLVAALTSFSDSRDELRNLAPFLALLKTEDWGADLVEQLGAANFDGTVFIPPKEALDQVSEITDFETYLEQIVRYHVVTQPLLPQTVSANGKEDLPTLQTDEACKTEVTVQFENQEVASVNGEPLADPLGLVSCDTNPLTIYLLNGLLDPQCGLSTSPSSPTDGGPPSGPPSPPGDAAATTTAGALTLVLAALAGLFL